MYSFKMTTSHPLFEIRAGWLFCVNLIFIGIQLVFIGKYAINDI